MEKCIICNTPKPKEEPVEVKKVQSSDGKELPSIKTGIASLLFSEKRSDVHFLLGREDESKQKIPAHRAILAARSEIFAKLFYGPWSEANSGDDIVIDDVDPKAFRALISAIYTDSCELDDSIVLGALYCAAKYQCAALLKNVNSFVKDQCSVGNACGVLQQLPTVFAGQTSALRFIEENCFEVISTRGWNELSIDKMELILRSDRLTIQEIELFRAVLKWAKVNLGEM
jgi:BTB/POZ domain-containing protein 9